MQDGEMDRSAILHERPLPDSRTHFLLFGIVSALLLVQAAPAWSESSDVFEFFQEEARAAAARPDSSDVFQFYQEEAQVLAVESGVSSTFQFFQEEAQFLAEH